MEHYEKLYIEESGDERPLAESYINCIAYDSAYIQWYKGFIEWLCKRLEKVEKIVSDMQNAKNAEVEPKQYIKKIYD